MIRNAASGLSFMNTSRDASNTNVCPKALIQRTSLRDTACSTDDLRDKISCADVTSNESPQVCCSLFLVKILFTVFA